MGNSPPAMAPNWFEQWGGRPENSPRDSGSGRGGFEPEILPPNAGLPPNPGVPGNMGSPPHAGYGPPPAARRRRPRWSVAPATYLLLGINCAVFLIMVLRGISPFNPNPVQLLTCGADNAGAVLFFGEWWRIVTAMFVHVGFLHLATNMWCLWNLGLLAEPLMGSVGVALVYLLTGAAGNLLSTLFNWFYFHGWETPFTFFGPVGAGASGAVFGIAGALIILLKSNRLPVPGDEVKKLRRSVIYFAVINLVIGGGITVGTSVIGSGIQVDNMAHLGGVACGLLFAMPMVPRLGAPRTLFNRRLRIAGAMTLTLLILMGFYLAQLPR